MHKPHIEAQVRLAGGLGRVIAHNDPARLSNALYNIRQGAILKARRDVNHFVQMVMRDELGEGLVQAPHHRIWHAHVAACWKAGKHAAVLAPWAHGKSVNLILGLPLFLLGNDVNLRIKVVSNSDDTAQKRVAEIAGNIATNEMYKAVFPWVRPASRNPPTMGGSKLKAHRQARKKVQWTRHEIILEKPGSSIDPSLQARGILTTGIGGRADVLLFDDVCDQKNSVDEPKQRQKVVENFHKVWMGRLEPHGRALYVGTPWHQADLTHQLYKESGWSVLRMWVSDDYERLEMEVFNPPTEYPIPAFEAVRTLV